MEIDIKKSIYQIEEAIQNLRLALTENLARLEEKFKTDSGNIYDLVDEIKKVARDLGLDHKLIEIYEEIKRYPDWKPETAEQAALKSRIDAYYSQQKEYKYLQQPHISEVQNPKGRKNGVERTVSFLLKGKRYLFTYHDAGPSTDFDGDRFYHTQLKLTDITNEGKELIQIEISVENVEHVTILKPYEVSAFLVGDWIKDFMEIYEKLLSSKEEQSIRQKYDPDIIAELKSRFNIE